MMSLDELLGAVEALRTSRRGMAADGYWGLLKRIATRPDGLRAADLCEQLHNDMGVLGLTSDDVRSDLELQRESAKLRGQHGHASDSERLREIDDRFAALCHGRSTADVRRERHARGSGVGIAAPAAPVNEG